MSDLLNKTVKGAYWSGIDVLFRQVTNFVINLVLARLLFPEDYGILGIVLVFTGIMDVIIDGGFSVALIRKKERTENDLSTAFFFNVILGFLGYSFLFFIAPYVSIFFNDSSITNVLRVVGLGVIFNSFSIVQNAILTAELRLSTYTKISVSTQIICGAVGVYMAYKGFGVWSLVTQITMSYFLKMVLLWLLAKWRPKFVFDTKSFGYLWNFGSKLLASSLIGTLFYRAYTFVIGKFVGKYELGLFTRAESLGQQAPSIFSYILQKVVVPSLSIYQDDKNKLVLYYRKYITIVSFLLMPLMVYCISEARTIFLVLFGEKWLQSVPMFQLLCVGFVWYPFANMGLYLLQIIGKSGQILKLEFYKKPIGILIIAAGIPFGIWGIIISKVVVDTYCFCVNLSVLRRELDYKIVPQILDIVKYIIPSLSFFIASFFIEKFYLNNIIQAVLVLVAGSVSYIILVYILKFEAIHDLSEIKKRYN